MVKSQTENGTISKSVDHLASAINDALATGVTEDAIHTMVQTAVKNSAQGVAAEFPDQSPASVYTELPDGWIDLPSAARKYDVNLNTLRSWVHTGRLEMLGRLKAPAYRGGYVMVDESALVAYMNAPRNKGGRPRKSSND